jgi:hypothetical protein
LIVKSEFQKLPDFIKEEFRPKRPDISDWDQVYLSISTQNDDVMFFGLCRLRDTSCSDDVGYTVGSAISIGGVYKNQYDVEVKFENGLYSKAIPGTEYKDAKGERYSQQNIRTEGLVELIISSARQNNLFYWTLGTGIVGMSSVPAFGFLDAANEQRYIHNVLNSIKPDLAVNRINVDDGKGDKWGLYLMAGYGMQTFFTVGNGVVNGRAYAQITPRVSNLDNYSNLKLELGAEAGHTFSGKQRTAVGGSLASTIHSQGVLNEASVYIKYESGKHYESTLGFTCGRGKLQNYNGYNIPNIITGKPDCLYKLNLRYYLDR